MSAESAKATQNYRDKTALIVRKNVHAFSQFHVSLTEQLAIAATWADLLCEVVPENRLDEVWQYTFDRHKTDFPITAIAVKNSWLEIQEKEAADIVKREVEEKENNLPAHCSNMTLHFSGEFNGEKINLTDGLILTLIGGMDGEEKLCPCPHCRPTAFAQFQERRKNTIAAENAVKQVMTPKFNDAVGLIDSLITQLGKEALKGNGRSAKGQEILWRVKARLRV